MDELLDFLERYAPGYRRSLQGAHKWRISELEETFGKPLPAFYRAFASVMGINGGPLLAHVDTHEPTKIAELYRFASVELPPRRFLFVFGDPSLDEAHYWLDLEAPSEDGDHEVVRMPFGTDAWETSLSRYYVSLREMLFVWGMENVCLSKFSLRASYFVSSTSQDAPEIEDLAASFEKLGFRRLPYPRHCLLFERGDACIELSRRPDAPNFWFRAGGRDPKEFQRFRAIIEDLGGVEKM
ncbi:hypothetical protein [Hyalangium gracile]|uniref:hypothetical protein n=1 Tax=Hyalangium gracile TaxID=394092 RepID=UPI001CCC547C|nr:hypothetical protein [Hyalangium gracile]